MHHKLTIAAIAVAAALGSLTAILPGTAAAEAVYHVVSGTEGLGVRVPDAASLGSNSPVIRARRSTTPSQPRSEPKAIAAT